jgi:alpha-aminoadipic semialdehyde synthase
MKGILGIRREDKSKWERRAPLAPEHVRALKEEHGLDVVIQPSDIRVFTDDEYRAVGTKVDEDLSGCNLVVAVKEIPKDLLRTGGAYMYFSHTIKAQPYNMAMLGRILDRGCTLIDHEKVTDERGVRLVGFSYHAGLAGMIDTLWSLGQRLRLEGISTPFERIGQAYTYSSLDAALEELRAVASAIKKDGLPRELGPVVIGLAGYGQVSRGAQFVLDELEPESRDPSELEGLEAGKLFKVVFKEEHMVERTDGSAFDLQTYYTKPELHRPVFERYLESLTVLVNCIYWEDRYPRLVTNDDLRRRYAEGPSPKLRVIGDISCDIDGAIQATVKPTQPDSPVYVFDPRAGQAIDGVEGAGPVIMAVDNLPCELPKDATMTFGSALVGLLPEAVTADFGATFDDLALPPPLKRAVIAHGGELAPEYRYLGEHVLRGS